MADVKDCFLLVAHSTMDTALFLPPFRALELGVTGEVVDGVTSDASTMVHPRWAVLPLGFYSTLRDAAAAPHTTA